MNKIISMKALLTVATAVAACIAGSASAETPPGANRSNDPTNATTVTLMGENLTGGCVRFYANGKQFDLAPGFSRNLGVVANNKPYMASVFPRTCGGAAIRNVWHTPRVQLSGMTSFFRVR